MLYDFATKYAQQVSRGDIKPSKEEIADMTKRAARVAQLLRDLKRIVNPNAASSGDEKCVPSATSDEYRAPKRPWEEISKDQSEPAHTPKVSSGYPFNCETRDLDKSMTPLLIADGIVADGALRFSLS